MRYIILFVVAAVISFGVYLSTYLGAFKTVAISDEMRGPYTLVYKDHIGPYNKVIEAIGAVEDWAKQNNLDCRLSYGQYFDNPESQEEARLKSQGGCIMKNPPANLPEGFKVQELPERRYVVAVFEGSPGIGPLKVYPRVNKFMEEKNLKQDGAIIEIYEVHSFKEKNAMTTTYLFPVK
jgi:AraC family transcriptional regulator